jgi:lysophospholipase L1-like esterase
VGPVYGFAAVHEQVIRAAHEAGIESVVDLAPAFSSETPRDLWVSVDDAHPNERAHRILADAMYPELISLVE